MINIELEEIKNNLFFYQREKQRTYEQNERVYITKKYDSHFLNELKITEIIKKYPLFRNYCDLMIDHKLLNLAECGENFLNSVEHDNLNEKYVIVSYEKKDIVGFSDFLYSIENPRHFLSTLLETYKEIVCVLSKLNDLSICFYNLSANNIYYTSDGNPILKNIDKCIFARNFDTNYFSNLLINEDNFVSNPIEIHVIFFLLNNEIGTLTDELAKIIVENFVSNVKIFAFFSSDYRENYVKDAMDFLHPFINKPKKYIVETMLTYSKTWGCYSLSFLFTYLVANVFKVFSLKGTFMSKFLSLLLKCLHPNPSKRESIESILYKFDDILYKNMDWYFVSKMDTQRLKLLYDILQKE